MVMARMASSSFFMSWPASSVLTSYMQLVLFSSGTFSFFLGASAGCGRRGGRGVGVCARCARVIPPHSLPPPSRHSCTRVTPLAAAPPHLAGGGGGGDLGGGIATVLAEEVDVLLLRDGRGGLGGGGLGGRRGGGAEARREGGLGGGAEGGDVRVEARHVGVLGGVRRIAQRREELHVLLGGREADDVWGGRGRGVRWRGCAEAARLGGGSCARAETKATHSCGSAGTCSGRRAPRC